MDPNSGGGPSLHLADQPVRIEREALHAGGHHADRFHPGRVVEILAFGGKFIHGRGLVSPL